MATIGTNGARATCHGGCTGRRVVLRGLLGLAATGSLGGCDGGLPFDLVSEEQLAALGLQTWTHVRETHPVSRDAALQAAVGEQAARLLRAAGERPADWEIRVFASPEANAFVVPGRRMGIFEGMLATVENPAQLAAVIGHEIGHHQADHSMERLNAALATDFGMQLVRLLLQLGDVAYSEQIAAVMGLGAEYGVLLPYSRSQELEADRLGMVTMARAGYDPAAAIALWQRMAVRPGERPLAFLSTHPSPEARIDELRAFLDEARAAGV